MTAYVTLYRTLVRVAAIDADSISLVIPASNFDEPITFARDNACIPRWLLNTEPDYRFFAKVPILAERPEDITLWNCEYDHRTAAEQVAVVNGMTEESQAIATRARAEGVS